MKSNIAAVIIFAVIAGVGCSEAELVVDSPLSYEGTLGDDGAPTLDATIQIRASRTDQRLTWSAKARQPWITVTPAVGTTPLGVEIGFHASDMTYGKNEGTIDFTCEDRMTSINVNYILHGTLITHPSNDILLLPNQGESLSSVEALEITSPEKDGLPWTLTTTNPSIIVSAFKGSTPASITISMKMSELDSREVNSICVESPHIAPGKARLHRVRILSPHSPSDVIEIERLKRSRKPR